MLSVTYHNSFFSDQGVTVWIAVSCLGWNLAAGAGPEVAEAGGMWRSGPGGGGRARQAL